MILSIIIILLLIFSIYRGYHYGLILELIHLFGYVISLFIAFHYSYILNSVIQSFVHSNNIYINHGIGFIILFILLQIIINIISNIINKVAHFPLIKQVNSLGGIIINLILTYTMIFILLNIIIIIPNDWIQQQYSNSQISQIVVNNTPSVTHSVLQKWLK